MSNQAPITPPPSPPAAPNLLQPRPQPLHHTKCGDVGMLSPLPENPKSPDRPHRGTRRPILSEVVLEEPEDGDDAVQPHTFRPPSPVSAKSSFSGPSGPPSALPRPRTKRALSTPGPMHPPGDRDSPSKQEEAEHKPRHHRRKSTKIKQPHPLAPPPRRFSASYTAEPTESNVTPPDMAHRAVENLCEARAADAALAHSIAALDAKVDALLRHLGLDSSKSGIHGKVDTLIAHFGVSL